MYEVVQEKDKKTKHLKTRILSKDNYNLQRICPVVALQIKIAINASAVPQMSQI